MSLLTSPSAIANPQHSDPCPAKQLALPQRQELARQALAGQVPITELANTYNVSRKFVYQQQSIAVNAIDTAFQPTPDDDDKVLFHLPITKQWLQQFVLGLVLIGHCSYRGVIEILRDFFDYSISLGTIRNIIHRAVPTAREIESRQSLEQVRIGAHDEIFQNNKPVLVGVDTLSTYCYLLSLEDHRDGDTWALHTLELKDRGFNPDAMVADAGKGLRAGLTAALPGVPCRSDVFHLLREVGKVATYLENQAYKAMKAADRLRNRAARATRRGKPIPQPLFDKCTQAADKESRAIELADQVAVMAKWLRFDVLAAAGPSHPDRVALYNFILAELRARVGQAPTHLGKLVGYLEGQMADVLAFAAKLDAEFAALAKPLDMDPELIREFFAVNDLPENSSQRWHRDAALRHKLGRHYYSLGQEVEALRRGTVRASSLVENLNSRLRGYFFLRRELGNDYLALLQFFLNHRRFMRSECRERTGKSPAEVLTGEKHPHWLEMLGYTRFSRN
jgi:hypothetical protein